MPRKHSGKGAAELDERERGRKDSVKSKTEASELS